MYGLLLTESVGSLVYPPFFSKYLMVVTVGIDGT